jgi:uncharacterized protein (DUF2384 family)
MATNDTTMLIKLPAELKGSFQGLCKARGVNVSEELRRFMADEVTSAAEGMRSSDRISPNLPSTSKKPQNAPSKAVINSNVGMHQKRPIDLIQGKLGLTISSNTLQKPKKAKKS